MNAHEVDAIKHALNTEAVRRMLIRYFISKGYGNSFDRILHPAMMQDLTAEYPILSAKLEVVPHAMDINPSIGKAILGWNLFVLGAHRMFLGETHHSNLLDLARQIKSGTLSATSSSQVRRQTTPRRVINFIARVLGTHEMGYVDLAPLQQPVRAMDEPFRSRAAMLAVPQSFFGRPY